VKSLGLIIWGFGFCVQHKGYFGYREGQEFRVLSWGFGIRVYVFKVLGSGFRGQGSEFRDQDSGIRGQGLRCRVKPRVAGTWYRVWGLRFRV
jgi:hypothetical protein